MHTNRETRETIHEMHTLAAQQCIIHSKHAILIGKSPINTHSSINNNKRTLSFTCSHCRDRFRPSPPSLQNMRKDAMSLQ